MAKVIVTLDVMPASPEVNLDAIQKEVEKMITDFGGNIHHVDVEPVAFGLKLIKLVFYMDESKGSTDPLESNVMRIKGVSSVKISEVRRAVG